MLLLQLLSAELGDVTDLPQLSSSIAAVAVEEPLQMPSWPQSLLWSYWCRSFAAGLVVPENSG